MNSVWFMLMLAIPNLNSNYDMGEIVMNKKTYSSYKDCTDDINKTIETKKAEPEIENIGIVCVEGFILPFKHEDQ